MPKQQQQPEQSDQLEAFKARNAPKWGAKRMLNPGQQMRLVDVSLAQPEDLTVYLAPPAFYMNGLQITGGVVAYKIGFGAGAGSLALWACDPGPAAGSAINIDTVSELGMCMHVCAQRLTVDVAVPATNPNARMYGALAARGRPVTTYALQQLTLSAARVYELPAFGTHVQLSAEAANAASVVEFLHSSGAVQQTMVLSDFAQPRPIHARASLMRITPAAPASPGGTAVYTVVS